MKKILFISISVFFLACSNGGQSKDASKKTANHTADSNEKRPSSIFLKKYKEAFFESNLKLIDYNLHKHFYMVEDGKTLFSAGLQPHGVYVRQWENFLVKFNLKLPTMPMEDVEIKRDEKGVFSYCDPAGGCLLDVKTEDPNPISFFFNLKEKMDLFGIIEIETHEASIRKIIFGFDDYLLYKSDTKASLPAKMAKGVVKIDDNWFQSIPNE